MQHPLLSLTFSFVTNFCLSNCYWLQLHLFKLCTCN